MRNMKNWIALPSILLLAATLAAQTDSSAAATAQTDSSVPPAPVQTESPVPAVSARPGLPVPAGTALMVRLDTTLATFSNRVGDPFQGKVTPAGRRERCYVDSRGIDRRRPRHQGE